ncbi:unnamed protein product [Adineta ricciae]|uniref:Uncharacterized protein n=1 Tax=Adineta ricciae TaxID=249248 RepID=A0A814MAW2_ADIRI|nr:unnamed protein product [Adineta ricciae]CAF1653443.1 unnamed protein product [Adineta ricciae]
MDDTLSPQVAYDTKQDSDAVCSDYLRNFTAYQNRFCMSGEMSGVYKTSSQSIQSLFLFLWSHSLDNAGNIVAKDFKNVDGLIHVTDGAGAAPSGAEKVRINDTDRQAWFFGSYGFHQLLIKDSTQASLNFIDSSTTTVIKKSRWISFATVELFTKESQKLILSRPPFSIYS